MEEQQVTKEKENRLTPGNRKSRQPQLPQRLAMKDTGDEYTLYPFHSLGSGQILQGYSSLAQWMLLQRRVIVDGFSGVLWSDVKAGLQKAFDKKGATVTWIDTAEFFKPAGEIKTMVEPFLGTPGSVWGKRCPLSLSSFIDTTRLSAVQPDETADCTIVFGTGSALCGWSSPVVYFDVPKNEIQYRMRAGAITNLGANEPDAPAAMYKRFYFVDWLVLSLHKKAILDRVAIFADGQWEGSLNWAFADAVYKALQTVAKTAFRVRPWFEPGAWGGQWMKNRLPGLNREEVNYAWSFELIVPENGLVFESDGLLLELAFDFVMLRHATDVTGAHAAYFGDEFPIRFDFLDTWEGGNLSIQCHPSLAYIREQFGEHITQDETYYILDCKPDAEVFLGLSSNVDLDRFRQALEESQERKVPVEVDAFVQRHKAHKHDLFLIPNGTVHSAGKNNLVLEISATPYIFTFKMYDWLRLDLDGQPRAINIEHAFNNLRREHQGSYVAEHLIARPTQVAAGEDWEIIHLPTHPLHFYDVHRVEFNTIVKLDTGNSCQVLMLVEGSTLELRVNGVVQTFHYAETFVVPAAAGEFELVNKGSGRAKVVKAFLKQNIDYLEKY